jgi:hypothetical protein
MAQPQPEVLCERTQFSPSSSGGLWIISNHEPAPAEGKKPPSPTYGLSSVTVPPAGWKIHAVAIYTYRPNRPEGWLKVRRARLNVLAKKADLPGAGEGPRNGREVEVTVRQSQEGVYEVRASNLRLNLEPGEYWIGLTPIHSDTNGEAGHLIARGVRDARFDDVSWQSGDDSSRPAWRERRNWIAIGPAMGRPIGQFLSIRIEGWHARRGRLLDWPAEEGKGAKQLHLRFATFDPVGAAPRIPNDMTAPEGGKLWIVQYRRTVDQQARDQLTRAGATLLGYLPDDAYVVRLAPTMVEAIRRLRGVRWVGPYHPAYRLDPDVSPEPHRHTGFMGMLSQDLEPRGGRHVLVYLFDRSDGARESVAQVIRGAGGKVVLQSPHGSYVAANVPLDRLGVVAGCDAVCAIERRFGAFELRGASQGSGGLRAPSQGAEGLITLSQIRELCGAEAVRKAGGFEGLGVRVAFWDDGVRDDHIDLLARPLAIVGSKRGVYVHHGTPIAGILCGEGRGDGRARGLLPLGGLVFATSEGDPVHEDRYGLVERFVRDHHAVVLSSSASNWGGGVEGAYIRHYDGYSYLLDDLVSRYDLLICESIGNTKGSGNGMSGSWAKNALLVGGVHPHGSQRRQDHRPIYTSGPAPDGRIKPDLVHFAANVFCADASSPRGYGPFGGTSCAAPLVAGHCGLMMEMWADGVFGNLPLGMMVFGRKPHAATARALMINCAYRYPMQGEKPVFTRFRQGWGMPDLTRLYESRRKLFIADQEIALHDHEAVEYQLRVPDKEPELRVTMAYTDPPGTTAATKALVNDLDLVVIAPDGKRYFGNHGLLDGNVSREGGTPDRVNNVENVFLDKPAPGVWRVRVAAHRIAWGQRSGTMAADQDFALVVSGVERNPVMPEPVSR